MLNPTERCFVRGELPEQELKADAATIAEGKSSILNEKASWMKRAKRSSDHTGG